MLGRLSLYVAAPWRPATQRTQRLSTAWLAGISTGAMGSSHTQTDEIKQQARKRIKHRLKGLSAEEMDEESRQIAAHIERAAFFRLAQTAGIYVHCDRLREVDTTHVLTAALQQGKCCYAPLVDDKQSNMRLLHIDGLRDLHPVPPFGIREPSPCHPNGTPRESAADMPRPLDLLLLPGLGFDSQGRRLGRGGGYYDKLISQLQQRHAQHGWRPPLLVALAYRCQLEPQVPVDPDGHDRPVDALVTADGVQLFSERARHDLGGDGS